MSHPNPNARYALSIQASIHHSPARAAPSALAEIIQNRDCGTRCGHRRMRAAILRGRGRGHPAPRGGLRRLAGGVAAGLQAAGGHPHRVGLDHTAVGRVARLVEVEASLYEGISVILDCRRQLHNTMVYQPYWYRIRSSRLWRGDAGDSNSDLDFCTSSVDIDCMSALGQSTVGAGTSFSSTSSSGSSRRASEEIVDKSSSRYRSSTVVVEATCHSTGRTTRRGVSASDKMMSPRQVPR